MFRQLQEGRENFRSEMVSARSLQHVTDHQEPTVLHHVLLHRLRTLDKIANKPQQFRAEIQIETMGEYFIHYFDDLIALARYLP